MHLFSILPLLLAVPVATVTAVPGCNSDRDKDHRPRQNCTAARYSDVPVGFELSTKVLLFPTNQFSGLPWSSFSVFTEIYEIDLSNNKITGLTSSSAPILPSLSVLRLGSNLLTSVPDNCFSASPALTELYLHKNMIRSLSNSSFSGLSKLEILDLSDNHIQTLPELMMHPLPAIEMLYLESNKIKVMPDDWFIQKEEVPYLFLSANPWACSCALGYLRRYLEEYELNVYVQDGTILTSDAESLVCDSPQSLKGQSVIKLDDSDFCSVQPESAPMSTYDPPTESTTTTTAATTPAASEEEYVTKDYYIVVTWYETFTRYAEWFELWDVAFRGDGRVIKVQTLPSNELFTTTVDPTTLTSADPTTLTSADPTTLTSADPTTLTSADPTTLTSADPTTLTSADPTTLTSADPTTLTSADPTTLTSADPTTLTSANPTTLTSADPTTEAIFEVPSIRGVKRSSEVGTVEARGVFCLKLFLCCLLLCIGSALCSLFTAVRLFFWYKGVYKPLKRINVGKEQVRMAAYYSNIENEGVTVMYRSVLFISKEDEIKEGEPVEELFVNLEQKDKEKTKSEEVKEEGQEAVYRKTLYRVISKEEELESWREVMGECRAVGGEADGKQKAGVAKKRYSVILREMMEKDGGEAEKCDWVVGGWEVEPGEGHRSSWGEWLGQYLPSMPWGVTTPPKIEDSEK